MYRRNYAIFDPPRDHRRSRLEQTAGAMIRRKMDGPRGDGAERGGETRGKRNKKWKKKKRPFN